MTDKPKDEPRAAPDSESRRRFLQGTLGLAAANLGAAPLIEAQVTGDLGVRTGSARKSASALAAAIRTGKISAQEVVKAHLQQINAVNPKINAVVRQRAEAAMQEARSADEVLAKGGDVGPLHGVPFTIKDSLDTAGMVSTAGTMGRASYVPGHDATVVARLRAAGGILVGKTNTPELTFSYDTDNLVYGRTANPYDVARSPGGSSGGAAAIVATAASPFDLGSDTGGSIRIPAHSCGIAGLKPTHGRVSRAGHIISFAGPQQSMTTIGPLARYVEDLALIFSIIAGPDGIDPALPPVPVQDYRTLGLAGLNVATFTGTTHVTPTAGVKDAVAKAADVLADAGAVVTEERPAGLELALEMYPKLFGADGAAGLRGFLESLGTEEVSPQIVAAVAVLREFAMSTAEYEGVLFALDLYRSEMLGFMQRYDLILCPVTAQPAIRPSAPKAELADILRPDMFAYTAPFIMTGYPVVVVRAGTSPEGLPIGVQLIARPWREDVALTAAQHLESLLGGWQPPQRNLR